MTPPLSPIIPASIPSSGGGIYAIKSIRTGDLYVGESRIIRARLLNHVNTLKKGKHPCTEMQRQFDQYGLEEFSFEILQSVDWREACQRVVLEAEWMVKLMSQGVRLMNGLHYMTQEGSRVRRIQGGLTPEATA